MVWSDQNQNEPTMCLLFLHTNYQTIIAKSWRARRMREMATTWKPNSLFKNWRKTQYQIAHLSADSTVACSRDVSTKHLFKRFYTTIQFEDTLQYENTPSHLVTKSLPGKRCARTFQTLVTASHPPQPWGQNLFRSLMCAGLLDEFKVTLNFTFSVTVFQLMYLCHMPDVL